MRFFLGLAGWLLLTTPLMADEISLSFNTDAFRVDYSRPFSDRALQWNTGWLQDSDKGTVLHGGLHLTGQIAEGPNPVRGGLGMRLVYTNGDRSKQDGFGLGVGGFFKYNFPRYDRFFVAGHAYYAPSVLSVGELDSYADLDLRAGYNVMRNADAYIGVRHVKGDYDDAPDVKYDSGLHVGLALRF